jgi:hypothetical protein
MEGAGERAGDVLRGISMGALGWHLPGAFGAPPGVARTLEEGF